MTGLQLRNAMQENQSGQLSIQAKQLDLENQRKIQQSGEAIHQALIETGGDIEKALPKIAQISPELYPHYKKIVDDEKQQGIQNAITARTAQMQNVKDLSGQPAQEITTAAPVAQPSTYPGQVGAFNANTPEGPKQIEAPLPEQEISGIPQLGVPATKIRPQSAQQLTRKTRAEEAVKKQLDVEAKLNEPYTLNPGDRRMVGSQIIGEGAAKEPPKPSFEEMTYEDWLKDPASKAFPKNRVGFDRYKQQQAIERAQASKASEEGTSVTPESLDMLATMFAKTGGLPAMGMGKSASDDRKKIFNRAAELYPALDIANNKADFEANKKSLNALQTNRDAVVSFENTALKNLDLFLDASKGISDWNSPLLNRPIRTLDERIMGKTEVPAFNAARRVAINEIAKIASNPGLSGQLSDSARHEVESFIPADATLAQIKKVSEVLKKDMKNRHDSMDEQIKAIEGRIKNSLPAGNRGQTPKADPLGIR